MPDFILASYYWGNKKYHKFAKRFADRCKLLKIKYHIEYLQAFNNKYQEGINYKPTFICNVLKKFPNQNVVYLDIDIYINKYPTLFMNPYADFMCFNWNFDPYVTVDHKLDPYTIETAGGVFFFSNNKFAKKLLKLWEIALKKKSYNHCADDRVLAMVLYKNNVVDLLRIQSIPTEYLYIPQFFGHLKLHKKAVFIHDQDITTEEEAMLKTKQSKSRIPITYKLDKLTKDHTGKNMLNIGDPKLNLRLKKSGFVLKTLHTHKTDTKSCTSNIHFDINTVTQSDILQLWKYSTCAVLISNKNDMITSSADIATNSLKEHELSSNIKKMKLFMKCTPINYNLVHEWNDNKDKSINGLISVFNNNISYLLQNRIAKI
jgi:hypothetical protein